MTNRQAFRLIEESVAILKEGIFNHRKNLSFKVEWDVGKGNNRPDCDISWDKS